MRRLAADLLLIVIPFCLLSVAFFLGEQPRFGIAFAIVAALALWYVRPRETEVDEVEQGPHGWDVSTQAQRTGSGPAERRGA